MNKPATLPIIIDRDKLVAHMKTDPATFETITVLADLRQSREKLLDLVIELDLMSVYDIAEDYLGEILEASGTSVDEVIDDNDATSVAAHAETPITSVDEARTVLRRVVVDELESGLARQVLDAIQAIHGIDVANNPGALISPNRVAFAIPSEHEPIEGYCLTLFLREGTHEAHRCDATGQKLDQRVTITVHPGQKYSVTEH